MAFAAAPALNDYIAAGCLVLDKEQSGLSDHLWCYMKGDQWYSLDSSLIVSVPRRARTAINNDENESAAKPSGLNEIEWMSSTLCHHLFSSSAFLYRVSGLVSKSWIRMSVALASDSPHTLIVRVYILPDDVYNYAIPRSDSSLKRARESLLARLDFSPSSWNGLANGPRCPFPQHFDQSDAVTESQADRPSLLELFNTIPSPDPDPNSLTDYYARDAAHSLMNSSILGLNTPLYLHQRRSAAMMLQMEAEKRQTLDPRLTKVIDQLGRPWYYDPIADTCLRDPLFYDGPCGGILAEEMGSGKTLICLALILATRHIPATPPDHLLPNTTVVRPRVGSLADMAAACITRNFVPWRNVFGNLSQSDVEFPGCAAAIRRHTAFYTIPVSPPPRNTRQPATHQTPPRVFISHCSLIIVPSNLVQQWKHEIAKHTSGLSVLTVDKHPDLPPLEQLLEYDIILFSSTPFESLGDVTRDINAFYARRYPRHLGYQEKAPVKDPFREAYNVLKQIHFKRCIVDEGHRLGSSMRNWTRLREALGVIHATAKWIVTGTPSKGLFGVDDEEEVISKHLGGRSPLKWMVATTTGMEADDLKRIGAIVSSYLCMRPWANAKSESGDSVASWNLYMVQPWMLGMTNVWSRNPDGPGKMTGPSSGTEVTKHGSQPGSVRGTASTSAAKNMPKEAPGRVIRRLQSTLNSIIIRHPLSQVSCLLPAVNERVVYLDGSYQDRLALNLFSMMIIFNAVQSQRTDRDYFFHWQQTSALKQLVSNLHQASFFGGSFFSPEEIRKAVETAEDFLKEGKIQISPEDKALLLNAIAVGRLAEKNTLKRCANLFHEIPLYVENFPWGAGREWSLDLEGGDPVCTDSQMISALQKLLHPLVDAPASLQLMFQSGRFQACGLEERSKGIVEQAKVDSNSGDTLAGNTRLGQDDSAKRHTSVLSRQPLETTPATAESSMIDIAAPLAQTRLVSTASAKLSYLIDQIVQYQESEQIIVFYGNDNVAYYLAGVLEILQIEHLIYAKGLSTERKAQYVVTFNNNPKFRVLLMDITQAAFGVDIQSASRIYFIHPVLNPQVEAQAIGRARRISTKDGRPVTVETLVLRDSVDEVVVRRRHEITRAELRKYTSIMDDKPIANWIQNARILPMPGLELKSVYDVMGGGEGTCGSGSGSGGGDEMAMTEFMQGGDAIPPGPAQTAPLAHPQYIFGRGFGRRPAHPDEDLVQLNRSPTTAKKHNDGASPVGMDAQRDIKLPPPWPRKRPLSGDPLLRPIPKVASAPSSETMSTTSSISLAGSQSGSAHAVTTTPSSLSSSESNGDLAVQALPPIQSTSSDQQLSQTSLPPLSSILPGTIPNVINGNNMNDATITSMEMQDNIDSAQPAAKKQRVRFAVVEDGSEGAASGSTP